MIQRNQIILFIYLIIFHSFQQIKYRYAVSVKMRYDSLPRVKIGGETMVSPVANISHFMKIPPSVSEWYTFHSGSQGYVSILSMRVDHHADSPWYVPALHEKHSYGWNRTRELGFSNRPYACSLRFMGAAFESTLEKYKEGGVAMLRVTYNDSRSRPHRAGFESNDTKSVRCYYMTNKDMGSEFPDKPKTLGIAIYCPILLDDEFGPYLFKNTLVFGKYCRPFSEHIMDVEMHLKPSKNPSATEYLTASFRTNPTEDRALKFREWSLTSAHQENRPHSVCTIQTFKNPYSGPMLYLFMKYYQLMGWRVIVYDRFGLHYEDVKELLTLPGIDYYPFTIFQLAYPDKYNQRYFDETGTDLKTFYEMERNWNYTSSKIADTADQDADKTKTADFARIEYAHLDTILYLDADEYFFCPQAAESIENQRNYHQELHHKFITRGIEEMRYARIPYSGLAPPGFANSPQARATVDFTNHTGTCMHEAYKKRSMYELFKCWSKGSSYDNFGKSADMAGVCPFHYNHWSCDGMKGGGRDATKIRCRCRVALDMQNNFAFRPLLQRCHLMHFNDNKYRFQSRRLKHQFDKGDVTMINPIAMLFADQKVWENASNVSQATG